MRDVISISVDIQARKVLFCKNGRHLYSTDLNELDADEALVFFVHMPNGLHGDGYTFPFDFVNHYDPERTICDVNDLIVLLL